MSPFIVALLVKLTLIFAAGLLVAATLRGASPSIRHLVILATLVCGLTLPAAMLISPSWDVPVRPQSPVNLLNSKPGPIVGPAMTTSGPISGNADVSMGTAPPFTANSPAPSPAPADVSTLTNVSPRSEIALPLMWAIGFILVIAWLVVGRIRLRRIAREAWPLGADWNGSLREACREAGVTREVSLLSSSVVSTPLTWGSISPVILLPEDALDWSKEHRRIVLRHELAHVARRDSLAQLLAGFVCALYWFHPLVWMSESRLRAECERACDDRVVSLGTPPTEYASHLLEVARSARAFGAPGFLSVAMARPSQLEGRLLAVLNESRRRVSASRGARLIAAALAALVLLPLAAFRPVANESQQGTRLARVIRPTLVEYGPKLIAPPEFRNDKGASKSANVVNTYDQRTDDSTFQLSTPVKAGGTLDLDLKTGGGVTITSWDRNDVLVRARLSGRDWRDTRVTLQPLDGDARLASNFATRSNNQSTSHHFEIQMPRNFNVRIRSAGGSISLTDVSGRFTGNTGGGEITIRKANGDVDLRTGGGEIRVEDSNLSGTVATGGGLVRIMRVNGSLNGHSGSGPVIYTDSRDPKYDGGTGTGVGRGASVSSGSASAGSSASATTITTATGSKSVTTYVDDGAGKGYGYGSGAIRMSAAGGALSLPSAPQGARVTTGGGRVSIGPSGGEVYAQTGGGAIDIGPASGSVAAHTGAGDVNIELKGTGTHNIDVTTGTGEVVIVAPAGLNATLELEAAYTNNYSRGKTRIISDWPLNVTETNEWDDSHGTPRKYVLVRQKIGNGGGGVIRVQTVNGNIVLKRGS